MQRGLVAFVTLLCIASEFRVLAASAANGHVTVSCELPRVQVSVDGNRFDVYAPGYDDSFVADMSPIFWLRQMGTGRLSIQRCCP